MFPSPALPPVPALVPGRSRGFSGRRLSAGPPWNKFDCGNHGILATVLSGSMTDGARKGEAAYRTSGSPQSMWWSPSPGWARSRRNLLLEQSSPYSAWEREQAWYPPLTSVLKCRGWRSVIHDLTIQVVQFPHGPSIGHCPDLGPSPASDATGRFVHRTRPPGKVSGLHIWHESPVLLWQFFDPFRGSDSDSSNWSQRVSNSMHYGNAIDRRVGAICASRVCNSRQLLL